ncbi:Ser-Thr-rich GPI-anchored membrane family protein [Melioribacter sp. OK-6-Me]|uniref:Ser-Thr-rich GPI-anchored membrane family protein n=1 Tax=unclassified Melioribacter TaxID=2627329 RepID=UPI003EDA2ECB
MKTILHILSLVLILYACREELPVEEEEVYPSVFIKSKIFSPAEGDLYYTGSIMKIKWEMPANIKKVYIRLLRKSVVKEIISAETENDGEFEWNIDVNIKPSIHYRIEITNHDSHFPSILSDYFIIKSSLVP